MSGPSEDPYADQLVELGIRLEEHASELVKFLAKSGLTLNAGAIAALAALMTSSSRTFDAPELLALALRFFGAGFVAMLLAVCILIGSMRLFAIVAIDVSGPKSSITGKLPVQVRERARTYLIRLGIATVVGLILAAASITLFFLGISAAFDAIGVPN